MERRVHRRTFLRLASAAAASAAVPGCAWFRRQGPPGPSSVAYRRLSAEGSALQRRYDVVVIGSGYGGAIMAARLAPGRHLAVLERGSEWSPGSFPEDGLGLVQAVRQKKTNPLGLYDVHVHRELDVIVGSGLGGTSLINCGVIIEPDPDLFELDAWPEEIRRDYQAGLFGSYFDRVRYMLQGDAYPRAEDLGKIEGLRAGLDAVGASFSPAQLAVNFQNYDNVPNHVGVNQRLCTSCGDCVTGCNVSAKNTLNFNYLPLAKQNGAEIFTQIEVDHIVLLASGEYEIRAKRYPNRTPQPVKRGKVPAHVPPPESLTVRAETVILAAGSLGSTEILLRSRKRGLPVSDALGERFSGNADVLGLSYNGDAQTNSVGFGTKMGKYADVGPTIVGIGDFRAGGTVPLAQRFLIEEGSVPTAIAYLIKRLAPLIRNPDDFRPRDSAQAADRLGRGTLDMGVGIDPGGALNHSIVYLGMGHDSATGKLTLDASTQTIDLSWPEAKREAIFGKLQETMIEMSRAVGGIYLENPTSRWWLGDKLVTVHPLGGCGMGNDTSHGVVDHRGRVYDATSGGSGVHHGLYVMDAAVIPTSVGVNPLLTISALAERAADHFNREEKQTPVVPR